MTGLAPLVLIALALGLMIRVVTPKKIGKYLIGLVVIPVLIAAGVGVIRSVYSTLSLGGQLLLLAAAPLILLCCAVYFLPEHVRASVVGGFIYDMLKSIVLAPFRIVGWVYRRSFGGNR
jgi:hypothetical protein